AQTCQGKLRLPEFDVELLVDHGHHSCQSMKPVTCRSSVDHRPCSSQDRELGCTASSQPPVLTSRSRRRRSGRPSWSCWRRCRCPPPSSRACRGRGTDAVKVVPSALPSKNASRASPTTTPPFRSAVIVLSHHGTWVPISSG